MKNIRPKMILSYNMLNKLEDIYIKDTLVKNDILGTFSERKFINTPLLFRPILRSLFHNNYETN